MEANSTEMQNIKTPERTALMVHPADIIQDELEERGWSLDELAVRMGPWYPGTKEWQVERLALDFYMTLRTPNLLMGADTSERLARALGPDPQFWRNLDDRWREWAHAHPDLAKQQQDAVQDKEDA